MHDKINFSAGLLLLDDITVILVIVVHSGHETKRELVLKRRIEVFTTFEKRLEACLCVNISEQKLDQQMILNFEWNRVEVLSLSYENSSAIIFPEVVKVVFDGFLELLGDVLAVSEGLESDTFD